MVCSRFFNARLVAALAALPLLGLGLPSQAATADPALVHARQVLAKGLLFDGHNDLPWAIRADKTALGAVAAYDLRTHAPGQTDIPRLRAGGVSAQFWSVYIPGDQANGKFARTELEQIAIAREMIRTHSDVFTLASTAADVRKAHRAGKIPGMLGIEGGHAIENSLPLLRAYYDLGVRYMTLTHNVHLDWADSAAMVPPHVHGLTPFGEDVVREMNRLGMVVDLAHTAPETMAAALKVTQSPVIFSHAGARGVCSVPRNVPDDILQQLPQNGGVVMVTFVAGFVDCEVAKVMQPAMMRQNIAMRAAQTDEERAAARAEFNSVKMPVTTIAKVADHIDYIRRVASVHNIGIGGDFDGNDAWPEGLSDVSMYPNLFAELIRRGWSDADLQLLAGGNVMRVLEENERTAKRLATLPAPGLSETKP
jgi:membrane dipeptidase